MTIKQLNFRGYFRKNRQLAKEDPAPAYTRRYRMETNIFLLSDNKNPEAIPTILRFGWIEAKSCIDLANFPESMP